MSFDSLIHLIAIRLQQLGSVTLVANIFFAYLWLKEALTVQDSVGTFLVIAGAALSVAFGSKEEEDFTMETILGFWRTWGVFGYFFVVVALSCVCYYYARKLEPMRDEILRQFVKFDQVLTCQVVTSSLYHSSRIYWLGSFLAIDFF